MAPAIKDEKPAMDVDAAQQAADAVMADPNTGADLALEEDAGGEETNPEEDGVKGHRMIKDMDCKERRGRWAEYMRSLQKAGERGPKSEKMPEELAHRMISHQEKLAWYPVWLENNRKWSSVRCCESFQRIVKSSEVGVEAWLCRSQIADLYKSPEIADAILKEKELDAKKWRPHP